MLPFSPPGGEEPMGVIKCGCAERGCRLKPAFHCGRNAGFSRQLRTPLPITPRADTGWIFHFIFRRERYNLCLTNGVSHPSSSRSPWRQSNRSAAGERAVRPCCTGVKTIVLIDDDQVVRGMMAPYLRDHG